jgi:hypothetical protein
MDCVACGFPLEKNDIIESQGLTASISNPFNVSANYIVIPGHLIGGHTPQPRGPQDRPWYLRRVVSADPAAGAEISQIVPARAMWELISCGATLVTDATVANRWPQLLLSDATPAELTHSGGYIQAASITSIITWGNVGGYSALTINTVHMMLPNNAILTGKQVISTLTTLLKAGDNWGPMVIWTKERVVEGYAGADAAA